MPACSIIIVNYNTFELTCDCIKSVQRHIPTSLAEVIVVDNASSECEASAFSKQFPAIEVVSSKSNVGFSRANNLGIEKAKAPYILLLNSDTVLLNDAVSPCLELLRKDSTVGVVSGQLQFPDGEVQGVAGVFPTLSREVKELLRITRMYKAEKRSAFYLGDTWDYNKPVDADWVWGAFMMFRKDDLRHFPEGKLHEDFFMYYEDVQWCYHFKKVLGKRVCYIPEPKVMHYLGKSDLATTNYDEKFFSKILPNQFQWLKQTRGILYTRLYYLIRSIFYFSLRRKDDMDKGRRYLKYALP